MTVRVYLDTNIYNRQFDDQSQPRIWLETQGDYLAWRDEEFAGETVTSLSEKIRYQETQPAANSPAPKGAG